MFCDSSSRRIKWCRTIVYQCVQISALYFMWVIPDFVGSGYPLTKISGYPMVANNYCSLYSNNKIYNTWICAWVFSSSTPFTIVWYFVEIKWPKEKHKSIIYYKRFCKIYQTNKTTSSIKRSPFFLPAMSQTLSTT